MNDFLTELAALMQKHKVAFEVEPDWGYNRDGGIYSDFTMHVYKSGVKFEKADFREIARGEKIKVINHETIKQAIK